MFDKKILSIIILLVLTFLIIIVAIFVYKACRNSTDEKDNNKNDTNNHIQYPTILQNYESVLNKNVEDYISKEEALKKREEENKKPHKVREGNPIFEKLIKDPPLLDKHISIVNKYNPKNLMEDYEYLKNYSKAVLDDINTFENYQVRTNRNPIIFVPGIGGTQLVSENTDWKKFTDCSFYQRFDGTAWVGLNPNSGGTCNASIVKPVYDGINNTVKSNSGTTIKVKGKLGSFDACSCFNDTAFCLAGATEYAKKFKKALENVGYKEMTDLFAVGYDFRLVPHLGNYKLDNFADYGQEGNHFGRFFLNMKEIIERAYLNSKDKKVFLVGHSMGGLLVNAFLNVCRRVLGNQKVIFNNISITWNQWVDTCIGGFIPVAAAFDAGSKGLKSMLTGFDPGVNIGTDSYWRSIEQSMIGNILLIPMIQEVYKDNTIIIINDEDPVKDKKIFTNNDLGENSSVNKLLNDYKFTNVLNLYKNVFDIKLLGLHDAQVDTYLVYSNSLDTEAGGYEYDQKDGKINFDKIKSMYYTKGDGTVPESVQTYSDTDHVYNIDINFKNKSWYQIDSNNKLTIKKWSKIKERKLFPSDHVEIISKNADVHKYIINIISK